MKISHLCQWSSLQWFLENITEANLLRLVSQTILEGRRNCPSRELPCSCGKQRKNTVRGIHCLSQRDVEVAVLILVLTVFVISIIAQWWLWHGPETVWKILLPKTLAKKIRGLCFGNMGSSCLGTWSNFIWKRDLYLFEAPVIKRVFSGVQGKKGPFSVEEM